MADRDGLTGLQLRADYDEALKVAKQSELAIVYFDVNNLKYTNDNMGHKLGDKLLCTCTEVLKENFRDKELFRTGGDEFIAVMEGIGPAVIEKKLKKVTETLEEKTRTDEDGVIYQIAAGYCVGDGSMTKQEIVEAAESKMYINKKEIKKNRPVINDPRNVQSEPIFREVVPTSKIKLPEDLDKDISYIEKKYTSTTKETILKCVLIIGATAAIAVYLTLFA